MQPAERATPVVRGRWLFGAWCLLWSVPMTWIQLFGPSRNISDYITHVEIVEHLAAGKLEVPDPIFHGLAAGLGALLSIPVAVIVVIAMFQVALGVLVYRELFDAWVTRLGASAAASRAAFLTATAVLLSGPVSVVTFPQLFLGYFITATYHNPTFQALKPFALMTFLSISKLLLPPSHAVGEQPSWRVWLAFGGLTVFMTLAKPSLSIVLPAALLLFFVTHARTLDLRRFILGSAVLGAALAVVLAWQYVFLYGMSLDTEGIAWAPLKVARRFEPSTARLAMKVALSLLFPLSVLALNFRGAVRHRPLVFAWLCFLVSATYWLLLAERGRRAFHGNFGWGVGATLFLVFFSSEMFLARRTDRVWSAPSQLLPHLALGVHFLCGLLWYAASANWLGASCNDRYGNWCW